MEFNSRRSPVVALHGCAATSQALASAVGVRILQAGGNAADAAVAIAAALNVTEPCSTGIGGDCFALFFSAKDGRVHGVNGSGRSPAGLTLDVVRAEGIEGRSLPTSSVHCVTVPGAPCGWVDVVERFGCLPLAKVLEPGIQMAEEGVPVQRIAAHFWERRAHLLTDLARNPHGGDMLLPEGRAPRETEIIALPHLASTFRRLAEKGKAGFYEGPVAEAIVRTVQSLGGTLTLGDLQSHHSTFDDPIKVNYKWVDVWEIPPTDTASLLSSRSTSWRTLTCTPWATTRRSTSTLSSKRCA
jgi:gamma-glutamyltranspeptidase/glutathione hydrolase